MSDHWEQYWKGESDGNRNNRRGSVPVTSISVAYLPIFKNINHKLRCNSKFCEILLMYSTMRSFLFRFQFSHNQLPALFVWRPGGLSFLNTGEYLFINDLRLLNSPKTFDSALPTSITHFSLLACTSWNILNLFYLDLAFFDLFKKYLLKKLPSLYLQRITYFFSALFEIRRGPFYEDWFFTYLILLSI